MKKYTSKLFALLKKKRVYIPLIIVLLIVGWFTYAALKPKNYEVSEAKRIDFAREVSVTGKVVAAEDVELGFESSGRVASIPVQVGAKVRKGQLLASVGSTDVYAVVLQREAQLQAARAQLSALEKGLRDEELGLSQTAKEQAETSLLDAISDAYVSIDDAIRSDSDQFLRNPESFSPQVIASSDYDEAQEIERLRVEIKYLLNDWEDSLSYLPKAKNNLYFVRDYLNRFTMVISAIENNDNYTDAEVATYKGVLSSARGTISGAISNLNAAEKAWLTASQQLDLDEAGATFEDLEIERANVKSAEASLLQVRAELAKSSIVAPFEGVVTKIDLRVGELVSPNTPVVSMISSANFEIESFIPEADIAKVKVGNIGTTTLDAYGDDITFEVVVTAIELGNTEVDGVATYKTNLQFVAFDDRIRSGMTANIDLLSETRSGVLAVPQSALISKAGARTVLVKEGNKFVSREVKTGSIDAAGNIEILEGVSEGEQVAVNPPKN